MNALNRAEHAYSTTANPVRTERGLEYEAFARATRRLSEASKPKAPFATLAEALHTNNRFWNIIAAACADDDNQLPRDLRARLFYLCEFTRQHSQQCLNGEAEPGALVEINRAVMAGLRAEGPGR